MSDSLGLHHYQTSLIGDSNVLDPLSSDADSSTLIYGDFLDNLQWDCAVAEERAYITIESAIQSTIDMAPDVKPSHKYLMTK